MSAYVIVLASPVVALIALVLLWWPDRKGFGKIRALLECVPVVSPAISWTAPDADFLRTASLEAGVTQLAIPAPAPPKRDSVMEVTVKCDGAVAAEVTCMRLVDLSGAYNRRSFLIPATGVTIGRSPYLAEIVLRNPRISSRHAWIGFIDGKPVLRDLNSTNGTYLDDQFNSPVIEVALCSGMTICFARCRDGRFQFVIE